METVDLQSQPVSCAFNAERICKLGDVSTCQSFINHDVAADNPLPMRCVGEIENFRYVPEGNPPQEGVI